MSNYIDYINYSNNHGRHFEGAPWQVAIPIESVAR